MAVRLGTEWDRLLTLPGVYAPHHDTRIMLRALLREGVRPGARVLDIGTGSGALALQAAHMGAQVTAIDIARRAVACARMNAALAGRKVTVRLTDLDALDRTYDMVISNPPYVPSPDTDPPTRGPARAWDAGPDGRAVVDRICAAAPKVLCPGGVLLMVHSGLCGAEATLHRLRHGGLTAEITHSELVPFGPVLRSRLPWLRRRGLVDRGQHREELVVVRAERS